MYDECSSSAALTEQGKGALKKHLSIAVLAFTLIVSLYCSRQSVVLAAPSYTFQPPTSITVTMYRLAANGALPDPAVRCVANDPAYGCTINSNLGLYPFGSVNPVTVQIEGTSVNNRYLRDVVAQEMSPSLFDPVAIRAQAIAARTYAYWHIKAASAIDNSTQFQAFIPRAYDQFSAGEKSVIDTALADRFYMSFRNDFFNGLRTVSQDEPIFSEFSADAYLQTVTHSQQNPRHPYLLGVQEPISYDQAIPAIIAITNAHQRGMSQNGASRWALGTSSYRPNAGEQWSVRWSESNQILTHYYTGIQVRNANASNNIVTPPYRWVPLKLNWGVYNPTPILTCAGEHSISVQLQNTGTTGWANNEVSFVVLNNGQQFASANIPTSVAAGNGVVTTTVTLNLAANTYYYFRFDMKLNNSNTLFSVQSPAWPNYLIPSIYAINCPYKAYIPAAMAPSVTQ